MRSGLKDGTRIWWCRGGGAAVLFLLAVVVLFRDARDVIFWVAVGFFLAHIVMTILRYRRERRVRASAVVIRHHDSHDPVSVIFFTPPPISSLIPLDKPPQQTRKAF